MILTLFCGYDCVAATRCKKIKSSLSIAQHMLMLAAIHLAIFPATRTFAVDAHSSSARANENVAATVVTGATGRVWAFSESTPMINFGAVPATITYSLNGVATPVVNVGAVTIGSIPFFTTTFTPVASSSGGATPAFAKPAGTFATITSSSTGTPRPLGGIPTAVATASVAVNPVGKKTTLVTDAAVKFNKNAFARATDPLTFAPGTVDMIDTLNQLSLQSEETGEFAGFTMWMNSTIPGYETLYTLEVLAEGTLTSPNDLLIDFNSNPLLGAPFDQSGFDVSIVNTLRSSFTVVGNKATLSSPLVFQFSLTSASSFDVDFGMDSFSQAVPEPATLSLLVFGGLMLASRRRQTR